MFGEYIDDKKCVAVRDQTMMTGALVEADGDGAEDELDRRFLAICAELEAMDQARPVPRSA